MTATRALMLALIVALHAGGVAAQTPQRLSLQDAESRALRANPRIRAGEYAAMAATDVVREVRSSYFPTLLASATGAEADAGTRITAGGLNNPTILDRFGYGVATSQMVTDFGRTSDLVATARLRADSQEQEVANQRASVIFDVDRAYFDALRATAVQRIAQQTVSARQVVVDQVTALMNSGLKSSLDLSFAKVSFGEAQLLLVQAQNDLQASFARLSEILGDQRSTTYDLIDGPTAAAPPDDVEQLIADALNRRPDIARERFVQASATKFVDAERSLWLPTVSLIGATGLTPFHQSGLNDHYAALGVNVTVPVLNGGLFAARRDEAALRARVQQQNLQALENRVARDVRVAWLDAHTAQQRRTLTASVLSEARDAAALAQQRYNLGLSSIVELTQAQLNQTQAEIQDASARYEYQMRLAAIDFETGARK